MTSKEIKPSFDKLTTLPEKDALVLAFCKKAIVLLEEFQYQYAEAIRNQEMEDVAKVNHKISSTMLWIELNDFVTLIDSYKETALDNEKNREKLIKEVTIYCDRIKNILGDKLVEMGDI